MSNHDKRGWGVGDEWRGGVGVNRINVRMKVLKLNIRHQLIMSRPVSQTKNRTTITHIVSLNHTNRKSTPIICSITTYRCTKGTRRMHVFGAFSHTLCVASLVAFIYLRMHEEWMRMQLRQLSNAAYVFPSAPSVYP